MHFPAWLQNEGAWIAIGVSVVFVVAGVVMHRVFLRILKSPTNDALDHKPRIKFSLTHE
jgi:peptidoglycan/LPS O-acetylase OafA/YrhL